MRLWSLHPQYLDSRGLVALWREGLLAQKVLHGQTVGYLHHPQLERFSGHANPMAAIGLYLAHIYDEALDRGYNFQINKIIKRNAEAAKIVVSDEQMLFEFNHLKNKLLERDLEAYKNIMSVKTPEPHPLFTVKNGPIANWEVI